MWAGRLPGLRLPLTPEVDVDEDVFSLVFDTRTAGRAFPGIEPRRLVLALLAGLRPEAGWEGLRVFGGPSPLEPPSVCVAARGPGADRLQQRLVEALERQGVEVLGVYEGGPAESERYAEVRGGAWV